MGGNIRDTVVGGHCRGIAFHGGNISFPGLTFKHAQMLLDRTQSYDFLLVFYSNVTVSALQSILCQNGLAGRL